MDKKIEGLIKDFKKFLKSEIASAVDELGKISKEENRKHLQRLVYSNLINRFDVLIDNLLLSYSTLNNIGFNELVLSKIKDTPMLSKDFYEILLADDIKDATNKKVEDIVRINFLRERHSKKLRILLENCLQAESKDLDRPRVNANDGRIHTSYTPRANNVPPSIIGYADYLYSRRNSLVHGNSMAILPSDALFIEKTFRVKPAKVVGIKLSSIESATTFYSYLCKFIETNEWPSGSGFRWND